MARDTNQPAEPRSQHPLIGGFALPDDSDFVAGRFQLSDDPRIATAVRPELLQPESAVSSGDRRSSATGVMVPVAAVDEDRPSCPTIRHVRRAGKVTIVDPETKASQV